CLSDVCHTAALRRTHHARRLAVVGSCAREMVEKLGALVADEGGPLGRGDTTTVPRGTVFVLAGHGSPARGLGRELSEREPVFRETLEQFDRLFLEHANWSLLAALQQPGAPGIEERGMERAALLSLQVALAKLCRAWGVVPVAIVGHGAGEVAAACLAGELGIEDAVLAALGRDRSAQNAAASDARLRLAIRRLPGPQRHVFLEFGPRPVLTAQALGECEREG